MNYQESYNKNNDYTKYTASVFGESVCVIRSGPPGIALAQAETVAYELASQLTPLETTNREHEDHFDSAVEQLLSAILHCWEERGYAWTTN